MLEKPWLCYSVGADFDLISLPKKVPEGFRNCSGDFHLKLERMVPGKVVNEGTGTQLGSVSHLSSQPILTV